MRLADRPEYKRELETAFEAIIELRKTIKYDLRMFDSTLADAESAIRDHLYLVRTLEENRGQRAQDKCH